MFIRRCSLVLPLLLILMQAPAGAQVIAADPPIQWHADVNQNKQLAKQAEQSAEADAPGRGRAGAHAGANGRPAGEGGPRGPGKGGGPGGSGGSRPESDGPGRGSGSRAARSAVMLRPEMDFAAPLSDTLLLYRTRQAVVFGRSDSQAVVILPLSGEPVPIAPGVQAVVRPGEGAGAPMTVEITASNGLRVNYRYLPDPADPSTLRVAIVAERDREHFAIERIYHRDPAAPH